MIAYTTIAQTTVAELTIKHSRFIATAAPINNYEEGITFVSSIKAQYPDATHNCYAFLADEYQREQKFSDDGEPSGTAGVPMLEVLKRKGVTHVAVVVTRYFGGIKLGANGLVGAYTQAVVGALDKATLVSYTPSAVVSVGMDYYVGGKLVPYVAKAGGKVLSTIYETGVNAVVAVPLDKLDALKASLVELTRGTLQWALLEEKHIAY